MAKSTKRMLGFKIGAGLFAATQLFSLAGCPTDPNTNNETKETDSKTVNLTPSNAESQIKIYNHTDRSNDAVMNLAAKISGVQTFILGSTYAGFNNYKTYGDNITIILSTGPKASVVNGNNLTIYFDVAEYERKGGQIDAGITDDELSYIGNLLIAGVPVSVLKLSKSIRMALDDGTKMHVRDLFCPAGVTVTTS